MLFNPLGRQRRITQPTLVVQGTADQVVAPGNAEVLAGLVPDARLQRFDGAGHLLSWEQPKRFVRVVTDFLTDPGSAARASHTRPPGQLAAGRWATAWRCPGLEPGSPVGQIAQCPEHKRSTERCRVSVVAFPRSAGGFRLGSCQRGREPLAAHSPRHGVVRPGGPSDRQGAPHWAALQTSR